MDALPRVRALLICCLSLLCGLADPVAADEFQTLSGRDDALVRVRSWGEFSAESSWTYVICHGLGGTSAGDRFEQLCRAVKQVQPRVNVLLIDWSAASRHRLLGLPNPWRVAREIKPVGVQASATLRDLQLDPAKTTAIGESFGVYVVAELAAALGGVEHILAFNPANELGGFAPADLRKCARRSWSFHTYSPFDTTHEIAHGDFFLQTPAESNHAAQHTHGIVWLAERVAADISWLRLEKSLPPARSDAFRCLVGLDGELLDVAISRTRPTPAPDLLATSPPVSE